MYIDIVDVFGLQSGVFHCILHHEFSAQSFGMTSCDVVCIGTCALAHHLCVDFSTASFGVFQLFKD